MNRNDTTRTGPIEPDTAAVYLATTTVDRYTTPIYHGRVYIDDQGFLIGGVNDGVPVEDFGAFYTSEDPITEPLDGIFERIRNERAGLQDA